MRNYHTQNILGPRTRFAKVEGPLFSLEARGKIGDAIVFFPWKGRHAVRRWLKPTNPRDIDQRLVRQKLAAFGKNLAAIKTPETGLPNGSAACVQWKELKGPTDIWNAYLVKKGMEDLYSEAVWSCAMTTLDATDLSVAWHDNAIELDLVTLYCEAQPGFASDISPEHQLAAAAYAAYKAGYSSPKCKILSQPWLMAVADITLFASDYTQA